MTDRKLIELAKAEGLDLAFVTRWEPPVGDDLRPLIAMPNLPRPLHGVAPRTVLRPKVWNGMRRECYKKANDTCEICGEKPDNPRRRQAHEVYSIDYEKGVSTFVRCFCLDSTCHLSCIHNGRALTMYNKGEHYITAASLLEGAEKAFSLIHDYNEEHGTDLRLYSTYIAYLAQEELKAPMLELIKKYDTKFYMEDLDKMAKWKEWKLVVNGKEHPTPYKNEKAWERAMEEKNYNDNFLRPPSLKLKQISKEEIEEEHIKLKGF